MVTKISKSNIGAIKMDFTVNFAVLKSVLNKSLSWSKAMKKYCLQKTTISTHLCRSSRFQMWLCQNTCLLQSCSYDLKNYRRFSTQLICHKWNRNWYLVKLFSCLLSLEQVNVLMLMKLRSNWWITEIGENLVICPIFL